MTFFDGIVKWRLGNVWGTMDDSVYLGETEPAIINAPININIMSNILNIVYFENIHMKILKSMIHNQIQVEEAYLWKNKLMLKMNINKRLSNKLSRCYPQYPSLRAFLWLLYYTNVTTDSFPCKIMLIMCLVSGC